MAFGKSIKMAAIQPPAPRLVARGTYTLAETAERKRREALAFAANRKPKRHVAPQFSADHLKLAALDKEAKAEFRARKRRWRSGAKFIVQKMFIGLAAVSGRLIA